MTPRVLHVVGALDVGGAERMVLAAAEVAATRGTTFDFLVFGDARGDLEALARQQGGRVLRTPPPRDVGPRAFVRNVAELLRSEGPHEAVHSHVNLASGLVLAAAHRVGTPVRIAHSHASRDPGGGRARVLYRAAMRRLIGRRATVLAACTEASGRHVFGRAWQRGGVVVPNGIDVERFIDVRDGRADVRRELGLEEKHVAVGMVARLVDVKNHDFILRVLEGDHGGALRLLVVGDGPRREELEGQAERLRITERVVFLGTRHDVPRLLGAMDVVAAPSHHEGLPVNLVEAQAAGIRVVASLAIDPEVDLGLGLVTFVDTRDPEEWRRQLLEPLRPPSRERIRAQFTSRGYDVRVSASRMLALYDQPDDDRYLR